jgi:pyridoxine 5-phosphate synthase
VNHRTAQPNYRPIRLGVNIDHVATVRQARGTVYPDPVEAALLAAAAGAEGITLHLREDRRHIQDRDVERLVRVCPVPVNLEMAATAQMLEIACRLQPRCVCLVPEKREERTTEGGLDAAGSLEDLAAICTRLGNAGIAVSLFIDPEPQQLHAARAAGAPHIEIHTGAYADAATAAEQRQELEKIAAFADAAHLAGFDVHAGHGLHLDNVASIAAIAPIVELNIGHAIVARALFVGMPTAVAEMRAAMIAARRGAAGLPAR